MTRSMIVLGCVLSISTASHLRGQADDLTVLPRQIDGQPTADMLTRHLKGRAYKALERRLAVYETLETPEQLASYQERTRTFFMGRLGEFPERTPLNARVVGTIRRDGYRVDKLIYESQPRHLVTAALYLPDLPDTAPPFPAVLVPCGHSRDGKISNQRVCILLAKHGIAALCYDPIGQGERYQLLDENGKPRFKSTTEHTLVGASAALLGRNTATYRVWDGMRSIDYLCARDDVDASRIGVTGCSGGGTLTSYLMALDDRVACAAPSCYLTSFRRLIETRGPQDAEQNIHGQIGFGMDHADYVLMRAPRPTLILASTQDFFDIDGTWDTFRQAKRFYTRLGFPERVSLIETDAKHGYPRPQREAMLRWMQRWLAGIDSTATEPELDVLPASGLLCTPGGQVLLLEGARSVVDLGVELNEELATRRREIWKSSRQALKDVRRLAGVRELAELAPPEIRRVGIVERDGYRVEKIVLVPEAGILLPALLFRPAAPTGGRTLYLHGSGKAVDARPGGPIEERVRAGVLVLAVDVRGTGETGSGSDWDDSFLAYLLGESLVGLRTEDVLNVARFLSQLESADRPRRVDLVAVEAAGIPALHAAALESQLFGKVRLVNSLPSWSDVVRDPVVGDGLAGVVHGALHVYDLPDLVRSLRPGQLISADTPHADARLFEWERGIAVQSVTSREMTVYLWFYEWRLFEAIEPGQHTQGTYRLDRRVSPDGMTGTIISPEFDLQVRAVGGGADLQLTVKNTTERSWPEIAAIIPCFNPGPKERRNRLLANTNTYFLGPGSLTKLEKREIHFNASYRARIDKEARDGEFVFSGKWPTSEVNATGGLLLRESTDGEWTCGIAWEDFLSAQGHNPWECMHLSVRVGPLQPGETKTVRGKIYLFKGTREEGMKRFEQDFRRREE